MSVTDDGIGMSQEDVGRIFERYKRLTQSERSTIGTGIGLHYVKQLLLVHKGSIAAEVRPEGGMRFTFAIPVDETLYDLAGEPAVAAEFIDGMTVTDAREILPGSDLPGNSGGGEFRTAAEGRPRRQPAAATLLPIDFRPAVRRFHGRQRRRRT